MICPKCQHVWQDGTIQSHSELPPAEGAVQVDTMADAAEETCTSQNPVKFTAKEIESIGFERKTSIDPIDDNGYVQSQRCNLCKWHIEQGNLMLNLNCKHRLHKKCLEVWFLDNSKCPICFKQQNLEEMQRKRV
jgi:hypothetical protein